MFSSSVDMPARSHWSNVCAWDSWQGHQLSSSPQLHAARHPWTFFIITLDLNQISNKSSTNLMCSTRGRSSFIASSSWTLKAFFWISRDALNNHNNYLQYILLFKTYLLLLSLLRSNPHSPKATHRPPFPHLSKLSNLLIQFLLSIFSAKWGWQPSV